MRPMSAYRARNRELVPKQQQRPQSAEPGRRVHPHAAKCIRTAKELDAHIARLYTRPLELRMKREKAYDEAVEAVHWQNALKPMSDAEHEKELPAAAQRSVDRFYYSEMKRRKAARKQLLKQHDSKIEWVRKHRPVRAPEVEVAKIYARLYDDKDKRARTREQAVRKAYPQQDVVCISRDEESRVVDNLHRHALDHHSDVLQGAADRHAFVPRHLEKQKAMNLRRPSVRQRIEAMAEPKSYARR